MQFDPSKISGSDTYKLLTGIVIPRPIGWISTISPKGEYNVAPFSFFNVVGEDPPHVMFSTVRTGDKNKDTLNNVLATKQFVVNMVTEDLVEKMNTTSQAIPSNESEFELAGLTPLQSVLIKAPRVKECLVTMECEMVHHYFLEDHKNGGACIIVGRVLLFHVDEKVLLEGTKINLETYKPVARLAGSNYSKLGEIFSIKRN
ncbi:flavin reductase family protein [Flavobacterium sp.]|jgi:flavin reductase (DIM6/NTAB) family NADH-FMN oxidoreductase RutF|uniref:flavin reductase family protein n=1 Tax=Flavobacterium sp. TaxID=239 RepID=UPI0037C1ABBE